MRKISTGDVFKMARLLKRGNILAVVKEAYTKGKMKDADAEKIGLDTVMEIMCSCTDPEIERQFYDLLAGVCEKKPEDIQNQPLETTAADLKRIFKENNIANFWKSASRLSGSMQG